MLPVVSSIMRQGGSKEAASCSSGRQVSRDRQEARKPLYLGMQLKGRVELDGPALRVRSVTRSEARYPLARISRVIANASVQWSADALQACLEAGIPIIITAANGALLGSVLPASLRRSRFSDDLEEFLDRRDWCDIYENWLRAARMRLLREWREIRVSNGCMPGPGEYGEMVRKFVYGQAGENPFEGEVGVWRAAITALCLSVLRHAGLRPVFWGVGGHPLNLLEDMAQLIELKLRLEVTGQMQRGLDGEAIALRVFHAMSDKLEAEARRLLLSLVRRVKEVLFEWH